MHVVIVGAGIGGLTTALSLHDRGIRFTIYEQSHELRELGVGINLLPHAVKILRDLEIAEDLERVSVRTLELIMTDRHGNEIRRELRGIEAGYDTQQLSLHRGRLQRVLSEAVRERVGEERIVLGMRLVQFEQDARGVAALFCDRRGKLIRAQPSDILVGADGIHSTVRRLLFPFEGRPRWNGVMMWRGATDWPKYLTGRSMIIAGGGKLKAVVYPIGSGHTPTQLLTNWAVCAKIAAHGESPLQDWSRVGERAQLQQWLDRLCSKHVDLQGLVDATPQFFEYPMCDRDPLPYWCKGRITLLGDGAHPMYPMGSNGASQAILDAQAIARCLCQAEDPRTGLLLYESMRLPPTTQLVQLNRVGGPERVIDLVEELAPDGFERIGDVISQDKLEEIARDYASAAGFSKEQVNAP